MILRRFSQLGLGCTLIMGLLGGAVTALAGDYEVSSQGKDEAAALGNLKMNALRSAVKEVISDDLLKTHARELRTQVFLKVNDLTETGDVTYETVDGKITAQGVVKVNERQLLDSMGSIGELRAMVDAHRAQMVADASNSAGSDPEKPKDAVELDPDNVVVGSAGQDGKNGASEAYDGSKTDSTVGEVVESYVETEKEPAGISGPVQPMVQ